LAPSFYKGGT